MTTDMQSRHEAQARYEARYEERLRTERPQPAHELGALRRLAEQAKHDAGAALDFVVACTPETFLLALAAAQWDERNPFYSCIHCHDGKDLPEGYVCQVCGEDNPGRYP